MSYESLPTPSSCADTEPESDAAGEDQADEAERTHRVINLDSPTEPYDEENTLAGPPAMPLWAKTRSTVTLAPPSEMGGAPSTAIASGSASSRKSTPSSCFSKLVFSDDE